VGACSRGVAHTVRSRPSGRGGAGGRSANDLAGGPVRRLTSAVLSMVVALQGSALALVGAAPATAAPAQSLTTLTADPLAAWQTNGIAWAVENAGGVVYVGGTFTK